METQADPGASSRTTLGLSITNLSATSQGEFADGNGQWLGAARRGYIDLAFKLVGAESNASITYYDLSSKVEYRLNPNHTVSLHVLYAGDTDKLLHAAD